MSVHQIVAVAVRLFALWLVMISFQVGAIAAVVNKNLDGGPVPALYFLPVISLFLAAFLWRFPMFVAHRLVPGTADTGTLRMAPRDATAAASAVIGLWALIGSIPHLATALGVVLATGAPVLREPSFYFGRPVDFLAVLAQCLLGLFLVTKPWFVARRIFAFVPAAAD